MNACVNCGNQEFEEEDGQLVCTQCGRQQEGGLQIADDSGDFGTQGKISRKKIQKEKIKPTTVYRGTRAKRLYLQAWQHILWKQAFALIHELMIAPPELWTVARDLWTLRLSQLVACLGTIATPLTSRETSTNVSNQDHLSELQLEADDLDIDTQVSLPSLWASISHIYVSAILLRLPISLTELYQLIRFDQIPFIRAIRHVPPEMGIRLPPEYHRALDTVTIPTMTDLQNAVSNVVKMYRQEFDFVFPALNWKILISEWIEKLALPIEVHPAAKRLVEMLGFEFTYTLPRPKPFQDKVHQTHFRKTAVFWPEAQLISVLVIATKLLFPFPLNALPSYSYNQGENLHPSAWKSDFIRLSWSDWVSLHRADKTAKAKQYALEPGKEMEVKDIDILDMSDEAIDAYMNWYQQTFTVPDTVSAARQTEFERTVLNTFPLRETRQTAEKSIVESDDDEQQMLCRKVQTEAVLPGDESLERIYPIFTSVEQLESLTTQVGGDAELNPVLLFHQLAADTACMDMKTLIEAVRYSERKLEKWFHEKTKDRRAEYGAALNDMSVD